MVLYLPLIRMKLFTFTLVSLALLLKSSSPAKGRFYSSASYRVGT